MRSKIWIGCFLFLVFILAGCGTRIVESGLIIDDNSKSLQKHLRGKGVKQIGKTFVKEACSGSSLKMVGFSQVDTAYKHLVLASHDLVIEVPADESRRRQAALIDQKFGQAIDEVPLVDHSPLLEVTRFESELMPAGRLWRLYLVSDLIQSTAALSFTPRYITSRGNRAIIEDMLLVCPKPKNPPRSVTLYWYPGLLSKDQAIDPEIHARIRRIFVKFFRAWAGEDCQIIIEPLQE